MKGPSSAIWLGWAGVLPFAGLTVAVVGRLPTPVPADVALLAYGAAILSFMGGAQWGVAMRAADGSERGWQGYAVSVLPALLAWAALLVPWRPGVALLAAGFTGLLVYDLWTVRQGRAPAWYATLRWRLTLAVVTLLAVAAALGRPG